MARVARNDIISRFLAPVKELLEDVINEEDKCRILKNDLRRMESLLQDITTLFPDELDMTTLVGDQQKALLMIWLQLLHNCLTEAKPLLSIDRWGRWQRCLDRLACNPRRLSNDIRDWNAFFDHLHHHFRCDLSMFLTSLQFASSRPFHIEDALLQHETQAHEGPLSKDESWMLFSRVAFKDGQVSMDIQKRARRFADECRGVPLAINMVAAMIGQTSVDEWDTCFSLKKNVDPAFPATMHPGGLDAELYTLLRWCYDALPNSEVRNCFLYCAMYQQGQEIDGRQLVEMWIGEGLVKSKRGSHVMDMAIGRKYLKLLLDRCFFQIVRDSTNVLKARWVGYEHRVHDVIPSIRVEDVIREMAVYIGQKEESCLFMARQNVQINLAEFQDENCRRISVAHNFIEDLPTELRFPKLACLTLEGNSNLEELPSGFLLRLTSLRVLNLSGCTGITSIPTSVGQLRLLEFLSLRGIPIEALPVEICHLPRLQFLDLSRCVSLISLPTEIGELKNLKHLNLHCCDSLKMIPREISKLTSLSRLQLPQLPLVCDLSVETEARPSIWSLKGLKNLMELEVRIMDDKMKSEIKDGIMGTWLELRHLKLRYEVSSSDVIKEDLPRDMKNMKNLQSFMLWDYKGLNLPNCKFEHLEMVELMNCNNIKELSRLEWLPNLKLLKLKECRNVRELGIGRRGRVPSGYLMLQKLVLKWLDSLESLGGASNTGVWDETTLPHLRVLKIFECKKLKRLPAGMEKLQKLSAIKVLPSSWWEGIMWEDESIKVKLQDIRKPYPYRPISDF